MGSTRAARKAGTRQATKDTDARSSATAIMVSGSRALTPNNKVSRRRVSPRAPAIPIANPMDVSVRPLRRTMPRRLPVLAPSAARMPSS